MPMESLPAKNLPVPSGDGTAPERTLFRSNDHTLSTDEQVHGAINEVLFCVLISFSDERPL
jgi:hypothetical protein